MRTANHKFAGWIDMIFDFIIEKVCVFCIFRFYAGNQNIDDIFLIFFCIFASVSKSSCWVETTIASMRTGLLLSSYSKVTWLFASGRKYFICLFSLRIAASSINILCARSSAKRHIIFCFIGCITKHHSLVTGTLSSFFFLSTPWLISADCS